MKTLTIMRTLLTMAMAAILMAPGVASAQVIIRFGWVAPPPVVEVYPGVRVVEDSDEEVFFVNGRYWVERDGRWYCARDHHERWEPAPGRVPRFLRTYRRGAYRHWRRAEHEQFREERRDEKEFRHEEKRREHEERRREHQARRGHDRHEGDERREEHREDHRE